MTCPVCGYDRLEFPPANFSICGCCGTEFGYDDRVLAHGQLTQKWVDAGCPWFDPDEPQPEGWNEWKQLIDAGLGRFVPEFVADLRLLADVTIDGMGIQLGPINYDPSPYQAKAA